MVATRQGRRKINTTYIMTTNVRTAVGTARAFYGNWRLVPGGADYATSTEAWAQRSVVSWPTRNLMEREWQVRHERMFHL